MKRNQDRARSKRNGTSAARKTETVFITYKRIPLGKSGVRIDFYLDGAGKKWASLYFKAELMAIIDGLAKRARMNAAQFIFHAVECQLSGLETTTQKPPA